MDKFLEELQALIKGGTSLDQLVKSLEESEDANASGLFKKIKGIGESARWNAVKGRVTAAEKERDELKAKVEELEDKIKAAGEEGQKKEEELTGPLNKKIEKLVKQIEGFELARADQEYEAKWAEVMKLVQGGTDSEYVVDPDYVAVLRQKFAEALKRPKKPGEAYTYWNQGLELQLEDGKSPVQQLATIMRGTVPEGFRKVSSEPGGNNNPGPGGGDAPDAAFYKAQAASGKAAGQSGQGASSTDSLYGGAQE